MVGWGSARGALTAGNIGPGLQDSTPATRAQRLKQNLCTFFPFSGEGVTRNIRTCSYMQSVFLFIYFYFIYLFFGRALRLAGSQFSDQGLNLGQGSDSPESLPLGHQGTPLQSLLCAIEWKDPANLSGALCRRTE